MFLENWCDNLWRVASVRICYCFLCVFDDFGHITDVVALGTGNKAFYYRMSAPRYHTLLIYSELLIVHEITNGPFERNSTLFGSFAPEEEAVPSAISTWQQELYERVKAREWIHSGKL